MLISKRVTHFITHNFNETDFLTYKYQFFKYNLNLLYFDGFIHTEKYNNDKIVYYIFSRDNRSKIPNFDLFQPLQIAFTITVYGLRKCHKLHAGFH